MARIIFKDFDTVLKTIEKYESSEYLISGDWDSNQHMVHCAQAVNYSIAGYPIENNIIMQNTVGKLAFQYFKWKGFMNHNTNQLTPGSNVIPKNNYKTGFDVLKEEIIKFLDWEGDMMPHHFYGRMSKKDYELSHSMHIANHFEDFSIR